MGESPTLLKRSQKSAEAVVVGVGRKAVGLGEGPNEKDSHETCRLVRQCIRSLGHQGARWAGAVKPRQKP